MESTERAQKQSTEKLAAQRTAPTSMIKKRKPLRQAVSRSDIYVTRERRRFNSQLHRARKLLVDRHYPSITIHGLGAAIQQAISLANAVKATLDDSLVTMDVSTDTVNLYDDVVPLLDCEEPSGQCSNDPVTQVRQNSAIHIKMSLTDTLSSKINARRQK